MSYALLRIIGNGNIHSGVGIFHLAALRIPFLKLQGLGCRSIPAVLGNRVGRVTCHEFRYRKTKTN
jgi:hypothetical protein